MTQATSTASPGALPVDELDELLAKHPFGDSDYVTSRLHACYRRRLESIGDRLPLAREVLDALDRADAQTRYRIVGDTVFRCAVQYLHVQIEDEIPYGIPSEHCREILRRAIRNLDAGVPGLLGPELSDHLGTASHYGWVWRDDGPETVVTDAFRDIVAAHYGLTLHTPGDDELAMVAKAVRLLEEVLPKVTRSVLSHTHLLAVFAPVGQWEATRSSSEYKVSGTIFLNQRTLCNPWALAEHLLHESLHQQLYDLRAGHTLLVPDFARADRPLVHSLWNMPDSTRGNHWDVHRALAAYHVYVYLALFTRAARESDGDRQYTKRYGPIEMTGPRTALARARYLREQIGREQYRRELGPAGHRTVDWLDTVLDVVDPDPQVEESFVHLLLDRFWREASMIRSMASDDTIDAEVRSLIPGLLADEVQCARSALTAIGHDPTSFDQAVETSEAQEPFERFASVRKVIAQTLLDACPRRYELSPARDVDEGVRDMVERSSAVLMKALDR
ncbi:aKG-HExxH-type peptide beta-hydroxylase [Embleya sp. NPDC020886]|uniref:aKG-HExxH-type peptide beta-hydroxylase n=1 Tax=Embleya sp. NPDC020886 TaxID=3363980 RepID=UPI0037B0D89C